MSDSYILHDVMRKVKADGLFDSIRRDLISDIEQKPAYVALKTSIESSMSAYLADHQWSSSLKKSELRERARRHIETSELIKDNLPTIVNQYMQNCQEQLVQTRLTTFVADHIDHVYQSMGGTHLFRPLPNFTQSAPVQQQPETIVAAPTLPSPLKTSQSTESINVDKSQPLTPPIRKESTVSKSNVSNQPTTPKQTSTTNTIKKKLTEKDLTPSNKTPLVKKKVPVIPSSSSTATTTTNPIKSERKVRSLSPTESDSVSSSPPPPVVRIASPLSNSLSSSTEKVQESKEISVLPTKKRRTKSENESNQDKQLSTDIHLKSESDTRQLRSRRPNPKYSHEQFETGDLNIVETTPPALKSKRIRSRKTSIQIEQEQPTQTQTPISPIANSNTMSPEYGTVAPSSPISTQIPATAETSETQSTSPRRLRPRRGGNDKSSNLDHSIDKSSDNSSRTSNKSQSTTESSQINTRKTASTTGPITNNDQANSNDSLNRSISAPDQSSNSSTGTDETLITRSSSKSFIWKPKISK